MESDAVHMTTPGKSGERWLRASAIVKSRDWYAPRRTRVYESVRFKNVWHTAWEGTYNNVHRFV
jgi:hypothetical protein